MNAHAAVLEPPNAADLIHLPLDAPLPPLVADELHPASCRSLFAAILMATVLDARDAPGVNDAYGRLRRLSDSRREMWRFIGRPDAVGSDLGLLLDFVGIERTKAAMQLRHLSLNVWPIETGTWVSPLRNYVSPDGEHFFCDRPPLRMTVEAFMHVNREPDRGNPRRW